MQIKSLRIKSYRSWRIDDNTSAEALGRLKQLEWVERLRGEGCSEATSLAVVGWSRATYYRWLRRYREAGLKGLESGPRAPRRRRVCHWTKQQEQQVLHLRKRYPLWGKRKLWRVLVRERGWTLSESTVGRIVARLVRLGRVKPVSFYYGQVKPKRRRQFTHHAKRWRYGMKAKEPGELMQADHMSINFSEGGGVKEFKATCPVSKWSGLQVYSRATSRNAKRFLAYLVNRKLKCPLFRILKCPLVDKEMAVSIILCISPYLATAPVSLQAPVPTTLPCASPSTGNSPP